MLAAGGIQPFGQNAHEWRRQVYQKYRPWMRLATAGNIETLTKDDIDGLKKLCKARSTKKDIPVLKLLEMAVMGHHMILRPTYLAWRSAFVWREQENAKRFIMLPRCPSLSARINVAGWLASRMIFRTRGGFMAATHKRNGPRKHLYAAYARVIPPSIDTVC